MATTGDALDDRVPVLHLLEPEDGGMVSIVLQPGAKKSDRAMPAAGKFVAGAAAQAF